MSEARHQALDGRFRGSREQPLEILSMRRGRRIAPIRFPRENARSARFVPAYSARNFLMQVAEIFQQLCARTQAARLGAELEDLFRAEPAISEW